MADCKDIYEYLEDSYDKEKFNNKLTVRIEDLGFTKDINGMMHLLI